MRSCARCERRPNSALVPFHRPIRQQHSTARVPGANHNGSEILDSRFLLPHAREPAQSLHLVVTDAPADTSIDGFERVHSAAHGADAVCMRQRRKVFKHVRVFEMRYDTRMSKEGSMAGASSPPPNPRCLGLDGGAARAVPTRRQSPCAALPISVGGQSSSRYLWYGTGAAARACDARASLCPPRRFETNAAAQGAREFWRSAFCVNHQRASERASERTRAKERDARHLRGTAPPTLRRSTFQQIQRRAVTEPFHRPTPVSEGWWTPGAPSRIPKPRTAGR